MPLTVVLCQHPTQRTNAGSISLISELARKHSSIGAHILVFPEAFLGGYPRNRTFGTSIGSRSSSGRDEYYFYHRSAVDLGDTHSEGLGHYTHPGDGTRQQLETIARENGVFLIVGLIEKSSRCGTLWCSVIFVDPVDGTVGKRRKVQPTGAERIIWGQGSPKTLKAVEALVAGQRVVMGAAICWENYMPLLRTSLYTQGVNLYFAPTADARAVWIATMRHISLEGRAYVFGVNQFVLKGQLPRLEDGGEVDGVEEEVKAYDEEEGKIVGDKETQGTDDEDKDEGWDKVVCNGGSVAFGPLGDLLAGPLWGEAGELRVEIQDVEKETVRAKLDFDASANGGHYSRSDAFKLSVEGLDLGT